MEIINVDKNGEKKLSLESYECCQKRVLRLDGTINAETITPIIRALEYLDEQDTADITVYINSPGGNVIDGFALIDAVSRLKSKVIYIAQGEAASMGAFILASGEKGCRKATTNSEIMLHQVIGGAYGQASDVEVAANRIKWTKTKMNTLLSKWTGQEKRTIEIDTDRDFFMSADEALEYGLIDEII